jgi:hypothetical protein
MINYQLSMNTFHLWFLTDYKMAREEELKKEGWGKRFTTDEPRLTEAAEQYKELGFEVLLEPVDTSSEECTTCITAFSERYRTLYTRRKNDI